MPDHTQDRRGRAAPRSDDERAGPTEHRGQGQSGYGAGRRGDDPAMQGHLNRNQGYAGVDVDRPLDDDGGLGVDDRFTGRGGQGGAQADGPSGGARG